MTAENGFTRREPVVDYREDFGSKPTKPNTADWLKRHYESTGGLQKSTPEHPARPQVITPPSVQSVDKAASSIIRGFKRRQALATDIAGQITGLINVIQAQGEFDEDLKPLAGALRVDRKITRSVSAPQEGASWKFSDRLRRELTEDGYIEEAGPDTYADLNSSIQEPLVTHHPARTASEVNLDYGNNT
jgi:hypothetical protein